MAAVEGFKNKSVIVTGAGSRIGRAAALQFAKQGTEVVAELNEKTVHFSQIGDMHSLLGSDS